jgi:hypothetical protein
MKYVATALVVGLLCLVPSALCAQTPDEHHDEATESPSSLTLRAFGSVNWAASTEHDTPNTFTLGQFALFATSTLNEHFSVLAEVVMEGSINTRVVTDLERLQLTFRLNDRLQVSAGRYHTGIGYYNAAFHHGAFFEVPIGRPRVFAFEDEGGVLPVHEVGLTAHGAVPGTGSSLHYLAEVGNGRAWARSTGSGADDTEQGKDQNAAKSTNVGLFYRPARWPGLDVGASFYRDSIAQSPSSDVAHRIGAAYAVYRTPTVEIMGEWLQLSHTMAGGTRYTNNAGYVQASKVFGEVRPYYRYDRLDINPDTPFIGDLGSYRAHIVGFRLDPAQWVGLKVQYERSDEIPRQRGIDAVRTQLVFVF